MRVAESAAACVVTRDESERRMRVSEARGRARAARRTREGGGKRERLEPRVHMHGQPSPRRLLDARTSFTALSSIAIVTSLRQRRKRSR